MSHRHLLCKHQYNCCDTDQSQKHFLCKHHYNCGDTDHSHRHLLCRHQYNCGDKDMSHRQFLYKRQYNCDDTDLSHKHLLCTYQYNCDDNGSTSHAFKTTLDALASVESLSHSRKRLRTVADGCERLRMVANTDTTFREHSLTPRPPNETGTLATHSGKLITLLYNCNYCCNHHHRIMIHNTMDNPDIFKHLTKDINIIHITKQQQETWWFFQKKRASGPARPLLTGPGSLGPVRARTRRRRLEFFLVASCNEFRGSNVLGPLNKKNVKRKNGMNILDLV